MSSAQQSTREQESVWRRQAEADRDEALDRADDLERVGDTLCAALGETVRSGVSSPAVVAEYVEAWEAAKGAPG